MFSLRLSFSLPVGIFFSIEDSQCQLVRDQVRSVGIRKLQVEHLGEKSLAVALERKGEIVKLWSAWSLQ